MPPESSLIRYRYSAPGGTFLGDKLATTGRLYPKEEKARRVVARYPVGSTAMIRFNPADPSAAILTGDALGGIWFVLFGLLCWIVPVVAGLAAGLSGRLIAMVLAGLVLVPTLLMVRSRSSLAQARRRGLCPPAGSCNDADIAALAACGGKSLAIRLYRELHGGGLKEARQAIEAMVREAQKPG